jgi:TatD DNase family protein
MTTGGTLFDTHCHLTLAEFDHDRDGVLARAREAGVTDIVTLGIDLASSRQAVELARASAPAASAGRIPRIHAAVGVHPSESLTWDGATAEVLKELARSPHVVALGECGLDYYRDHAPHDVQRRVFEAMLELARELSLPVLVHIREAHADALDLLASAAAGGGISAVLHCFSAGAAEAERAAELGFYLGFGGPLTYKKPPFDAVRATPRDRLLLETDAPYLPPVPYRGKRNESSYLPLMAASMGTALELGAGEIAGLTAANARRLFGLGRE